jgi:hypothetical protein
LYFAESSPERAHTLLRSRSYHSTFAWEAVRSSSTQGRPPGRHWLVLCAWGATWPFQNWINRMDGTKREWTFSPSPPNKTEGMWPRGSPLIARQCPISLSVSSKVCFCSLIGRIGGRQHYPWPPPTCLRSSTRGSTRKNVIFQIASGPILSIPIYLKNVYIVLVNFRWKKMTRTYPLGTSKSWFFVTAPARGSGGKNVIFFIWPQFHFECFNLL